MRRRPWPIVILAFFQIFCEPVSNVLLSAYWSHLSPQVYLQIFIAHKHWMALFYIIVLPPIMGLSVYAMKKWSYAIFVAGALFMLYRNLGAVAAHPVSLAPLLAFYLGNILFVCYFLLPPVIKPYVNPRLRWWETKPRYLVNYTGTVETIDGLQPIRLVDLAEGGTFLITHKPLNVGMDYDLSFETENGVNINLKGKPVFSRLVADVGLGYGFQFIDLRSSVRGPLVATIRKLKKAHTPTRNGTTITLKQDFILWLKGLPTGKGFVPRADSQMAARTK